MKTTWIILSMALALVVCVNSPALAQSQDFPFTCEFEMALLRDADLDRARAPEEVRDKIYIAMGEKKCNPSGVTQIRCETVVPDPWPNARNVNIKTFLEPCQWFLNQNECGVNAEVVATNSNLQIKRVNSNTASLNLFCTGRSP